MSKTKLIYGDCIKELRSMESLSVDSMISDIPYGIDFAEWDVLHNNTNSALLGSSPKNKESKIFKTRGKPLNGWSEQDKERGNEFMQWTESWLAEAYRVLKPCSPVLIMCGRQFQHKFVSAAENVGFVFKDTLSWNKGKAPFRAQRINCVLSQRGVEQEVDDWRLGNLAPVVEPIVYMFKPYPVGTTITSQFVDSGLGCFNGDVLTSNLINISSTVNNKHHETQKPVALMELLVKLVTKKGHTILDPFMGSGTTGEACQTLSRNFIGIEKNEEHFKYAENRLTKDCK